MKIFNILIGLIFLLLLIFALNYVFKHFFNDNINILKYEKHISFLRNLNDKTSENLLLDNFSIITTKKSSIKLKTIINKPKLIYRFSNFSCNPCVENDFKILDTLSTVIGSEQIIIIANFENIKDLIIYKNNKKLPYKYYNYNSIIDLPIEKKLINHSPFFLILDEQLRVKFALTSNPSQSINNLHFKQVIEYFSH